jgi:hypothetical protein
MNTVVYDEIRSLKLTALFQSPPALFQSPLFCSKVCSKAHVF